MKKDLTHNELIHEAYKIGKAHDAILTRIEIEEPRLKMYRVKLEDIEEIEYDEEWRKLRKLKDIKSYPKYEKFGSKLCLCDYVQEYRDKIPYYNKEYIKTYWIPLYDNSWELIRMHRKSIRT